MKLEPIADAPRVTLAPRDDKARRRSNTAPGQAIHALLPHAPPEPEHLAKLRVGSGKPSRKACTDQIEYATRLYHWNAGRIFTAAEALIRADAQKVTITYGTFSMTVWNTKENLETLLKKYAKL